MIVIYHQWVLNSEVIHHNTQSDSIVGPTNYSRRQEDIPESELEVIGEVIPDDQDDEDDSVPVRILNDFVIYDRRTRLLVPITELLTSTSSYAVTGDVSPQILDDDEDVDDVDDDESSLIDNPQRVELSRLRELNFNYVDENGLDPYVRGSLFLLTVLMTDIGTFMSKQNPHGIFWRLLRHPIDLFSCPSGSTVEHFNSSCLPRSRIVPSPSIDSCHRSPSHPNQRISYDRPFYYWDGH